MSNNGKERKNYYIDKGVLSDATKKSKKDGVPSMSWLITRLLKLYVKGDVKPLD